MSNNIEAIYADVDIHGKAYEIMKIELLLSLNGKSNISMHDLNKKYGGRNLNKGMSELESLGCFIKDRISYTLPISGTLYITTFGTASPLTSKAIEIIQPYLSKYNN